MVAYAIEDIRKDHPGLLAAPLEASAVARCLESGGRPWRLSNRCERLPRNGTGPRFVDLTWLPTTQQAAAKAERTHQARRVTEDAAIGVCAASFAALREGQIAEVTQEGTAVDYWVDVHVDERAVLEVSGIRAGGAADLVRRHLEKVQQLKGSRLYELGYAGYVFVILFSRREAAFTYHAPPGADHA